MTHDIVIAILKKARRMDLDIHQQSEVMLIIIKSDASCFLKQQDKKSEKQNETKKIIVLNNSGRSASVTATYL